MIKISQSAHEKSPTATLALNECTCKNRFLVFHRNFLSCIHFKPESSTKLSEIVHLAAAWARIYKISNYCKTSIKLSISQTKVTSSTYLAPLRSMDSLFPRRSRLSFLSLLPGFSGFAFFSFWPNSQGSPVVLQYLGVPQTLRPLRSRCSGSTGVSLSAFLAMCPLFSLKKKKSSYLRPIDYVSISHEET